MNVAALHIQAGWIAMLVGVLTGAVIGLFFHKPDWLGGYGSFRRRMLRLGHIAFFGMGFINLQFAFTLQQSPLAEPYLDISSAGFLVGLVAMPSLCFLSAWLEAFRHLFFVPVLGVLVGILAMLYGWSMS